MDSRLKVAIVGAGGISDSHAEGWIASGFTDIIAVVDIRKDAAEEKAKKWGVGVKAYNSVKELLNESKPDLIDICTPEHVHKESALEALDAGVPVLCEKIMASKLQDGFEMIQKSRERKLWTGINYNYHFFPGVRYLKEMIQSGKEGKIRILHVTTHSFCFHHILEAVLWSCGMPQYVSAQGTSRDWPELFHEKFRIDPELIYIPGKAFTARLEYADGLVCSITSSYVNGLDSLPFQMTAVFESGKALEISGLDWVSNMVGKVSWLPDGENLVAEFLKLEDRSNIISFRESMREAAVRFRDGIIPESTWEDGWNVMVVDNAMHIAGSQNITVSVPLLKAELEKGKVEV